MLLIAIIRGNICSFLVKLFLARWQPLMSIQCYCFEQDLRAVYWRAAYAVYAGYWSTRTFAFRSLVNSLLKFSQFILVNSPFMPFRTAALVTSLTDKFAPLLNMGVIESKQSIIN